VKIVIDSNVFISGIFWKGKPELVINGWVEARYELLVSKPIIDEYTRSLYHISAGRRNDLVERWLFQILEFSTCIGITQHFEICRDKTDNKWLDCAASGGADYIVSGDKDLLSLRAIFNISIVKPSDFLKQLQ
jgi:putative PIN family toxin of toxin-antitoxin system